MNNPAYPKPGTQEDIVLNHLLAAKGNWVELRFLMREARSAAVHSVCASLRKYGWAVENKMEHGRDDGRKVVFSSYMIPPSQAKEDPPMLLF